MLSPQYTRTLARRSKLRCASTLDCATTVGQCGSKLCGAALLHSVCNTDPTGYGFHPYSICAIDLLSTNKQGTPKYIIVIYLSPLCYANTVWYGTHSFKLPDRFRACANGLWEWLWNSLRDGSDWYRLRSAQWHGAFLRTISHAWKCDQTCSLYEKGFG